MRGGVSGEMEEAHTCPLVLAPPTAEGICLSPEAQVQARRQALALILIADSGTPSLAQGSGNQPLEGTDQSGEKGLVRDLGCRGIGGVWEGAGRKDEDQSMVREVDGVGPSVTIW